MSINCPLRGGSSAWALSPPRQPAPRPLVAPRVRLAALAALAALATAVFLFQPAFLVALLAQGDAIAARASLGRRDRRRGRTGLGRVLLDGDRDQALGIGGSMQATSG